MSVLIKPFLGGFGSAAAGVCFAMRQTLQAYASALLHCSKIIIHLPLPICLTHLHIAHLRIRPSTHLHVRPFAHFRAHLHICTFTHSPIRSSVRPPICPFPRSFPHPHIFTSAHCDLINIANLDNFTLSAFGLISIFAHARKNHHS